MKKIINSPQTKLSRGVLKSDILDIGRILKTTRERMQARFEAYNVNKINST